ncbi:Uncharacterized protein FWK35_00033226, partial [Aphis craccivora]
YGINRHLLKFKHEDNEIKIVVGVDGLPLSKSSSSQFWPILAYVYPYSNNVFPIGIYHGNSKPNDKAKYLTKNGIELNGNLFKVSIMAFCCDSPAKSNSYPIIKGSLKIEDYNSQKESNYMNQEVQNSLQCLMT